MMLELHNVILKPLRQSVSLTVSDGQLACICGPKGAGKTAVLRAVMGMLPIDGGHISIDGELLTPLSAPYFRKQMGYVPSRLVPLPGQDRVFDVQQQLLALGANRQLRLETEDDRPWQSLTVEERYLVLADCVVRQQRQLVLMDEPETLLSEEAAMEVVGLLRELSNAGAAVLMVSNQQTILNMTNNIIEL